MAKWHGINFGDKIRGNSNILKSIQKTGNTLRFTKGDDTTEDIALSSGGGLTETPLAMMSGRWQWSSTDDGERVWTGNSAYGAFGYYNFSHEPSNSTMRTYNSSHTVDTTTGDDDSYKPSFYGVWCPNNGKKVKAKLSFRIQNAPNKSNWGISLWSSSDPNNNTPSTTHTTFTLRAASSNVGVGTNSVTYYKTETTTTSNMNNVWVCPLLENRSGALASTVYIYGQIALYLVD